ncbi:MAG: hypothetical protein DMD81_19355 [Candidatus Rokuibacteriota bacterium]|nr:MAG: hypothetical protein DMD81_19355 [Candidatus Rokubacteria bacterium]
MILDGIHDPDERLSIAPRLVGRIVDESGQAFRPTRQRHVECRRRRPQVLCPSCRSDNQAAREDLERILR